MTDRFALASTWDAKAKFWIKAACAHAAVAVLSLPIQLAVADVFWSMVLVILTYVALLAEVGCVVRMVVCFRRAAKARRSGDTYAVASLRDGGTETQA